MTENETKKEYKWTPKKLGCAIIIIVSFVVGLSMTMSDNMNNYSAPRNVTTTNKPEETKKEQPKITESKAYMISKSFIRPELKSPSSADFPLLDFRANSLGNNMWDVAGYVDSKNSFGAKVRTDYSVIMTFNDGDWSKSENWTLNQLILNDEIVYQENEE